MLLISISRSALVIVEPFVVPEFSGDGDGGDADDGDAGDAG